MRSPAPALVQPGGTDFTESERERIVAMTNWNFGNPSVSDEWNQLAANSTKTNARPFPANVPVLQFLSTASIDQIPGWRSNHEAELAGVVTHELDVLDGAHYQHWTQSSVMATTITAFIASHVAR